MYGVGVVTGVLDGSAEELMTEEAATLLLSGGDDDAGRPSERVTVLTGGIVSHSRTLTHT